MKHDKRTSISVAAVVLLASTLAIVASSAQAHDSAYRGWKKDRYDSAQNDRQRRDHRLRYRQRDRAVFANEVDLTRPGGPQRFFELLNQENR